MREHLRLMNLDNLLGEDQAMFFEDWRDPTLDLLQSVASSTTYSERSQIILQAFNDPGTSGNIIQWFRVRYQILHCAALWGVQPTDIDCRS